MPTIVGRRTPAEFVSTTGMDALIHDNEAYASINATRMTDMLAARLSS